MNMLCGRELEGLKLKVVLRAGRLKVIEVLGYLEE